MTLLAFARVALGLGSLTAAAVGCVHSGALTNPAPPISLESITDGSPFTVVTFFSATCPCQAAHDARLRELAERFRPRGVRVVAIDSEFDASSDKDAREATKRGYSFPLRVDRGARLADRLGAKFATYTVILDARGRVRFRGGLDSDRTHLRDEAVFYVRDALDALLEGREPAITESKSLGCSLRTS